MNFELAPGLLFEVLCDFLDARTRTALLCVSKTIRTIALPYSYFRPTRKQEQLIENMMEYVQSHHLSEKQQTKNFSTTPGSLEIVAVVFRSRLWRAKIVSTFHHTSTHVPALARTLILLEEYMHRTFGTEYTDLWPPKWPTLGTHHLQFDKAPNTRIVLCVGSITLTIDEENAAYVQSNSDPQMLPTCFDVTYQYILNQKSIEDMENLALELEESINKKDRPIARTHIKAGIDLEIVDRELVPSTDLYLRIPFDVIIISDAFDNGVMPIFREILRYYPCHPKGRMKVYVLAWNTGIYRDLKYMPSWEFSGTILAGCFLENAHYGGHLLKELSNARIDTFSYTYIPNWHEDDIQGFRQLANADGGPIKNIRVYKDYCVHLKNKSRQRARLLIEQLGNDCLLTVHSLNSFNKLRTNKQEVKNLIWRFKIYFLSLTGNRWEDYPERFVQREGLYTPVKAKPKKNRDTSPKRQKGRKLAIETK